jgi:FtsZ-binding cell division protein ZapB
MEYDRNIHSNPDASVWARFFVETWKKIGKPDPDVEWMAGWFANAMMAMHDAGPVRRPTLEEARGIAARCWCTAATSRIDMDPRLAEAFAQALAFGEAKPPNDVDRMEIRILRSKLEDYKATLDDVTKRRDELIAEVSQMKIDREKYQDRVRTALADIIEKARNADGT